MVIAFLSLFGAPYEGGANWLESTVLALGTLPEPPTCLIVGATAEQLPATLRSSAHVEPVVVRVPARPLRQTLNDMARRRLRPAAWEDLGLRDLAERRGVDVWVGFERFPELSPERLLAICFPDFQFRHLPELFGAEMIAEREASWAQTAARANAILMLSADAADDARRSDPSVGERLHVTGMAPALSRATLGLDPGAVRAAYHLPERFLVVSNQFYRHKNHEVVLRALLALGEQGAPLPVVAFTGRPSDPRAPGHFSDLLRFVQRHGLHGACRFLGVVPRDEQVALVRAADAVIQPSRFEGRGAIAEEATLLGTPLLLSDIPVHRELALGDARLFAPADATALAGLIATAGPHPRRSDEEVLAAAARSLAAYGERLDAALRSIAR